MSDIRLLYLSILKFRAFLSFEGYAHSFMKTGQFQCKTNYLQIITTCIENFDLDHLVN